MEHDFIKGLQHTLELLVPELVNITEIKPYKKNAKKHDEKQIKNVAESIKQFGFVQPIVIDGENTIIIGHCRYEASKLLNYDKVPCIRLTSLTNEQVKQLRNLDNKLNESEWDLELLAEDINDLEFDGFDVDWQIVMDTGFGTDFELPNGDKNEICQMTFTLHENQKQLIEQAIKDVKNEVFETFGNENSNGNALYEIVRQWVELRT